MVAAVCEPGCAAASEKCLQKRRVRSPGSYTSSSATGRALRQCKDNSSRRGAARSAKLGHPCGTRPLPQGTLAIVTPLVTQLATPAAHPVLTFSEHEALAAPRGKGHKSKDTKWKEANENKIGQRMDTTHLLARRF